MIREFVRRRLISLIVVDEFDEIQNAKLSYRESYLTLMQELRHAAPNVQLFLLSATVTKKLIVDLNNSFNNSFNQMFPNDKITAMPCLYRTGSPLPTNHIYRGTLLCFVCQYLQCLVHLIPFCSRKKNQRGTGR